MQTSAKFCELFTLKFAMEELCKYLLRFDDSITVRQCFPIIFWLAPTFLTNKFLSPPYNP